MDQVQTAARAQQLDPEHITAKQLVQALNDSQVSASAAKVAPTVPSAEARAKRKAAIMSMHGIWKNDPTKPKDPVAYQREVRSE